MKISEINTTVSFSVPWEQGEAVRASFHLVLMQMKHAADTGSC